MLEQILYPEPAAWPSLSRRPVTKNRKLGKTVSKLMYEVEQKGDKAIYKLTKEFDGVKLKTLLVTQEEFSAAENSMDEKLKKAIALAKKNIVAFHEMQVAERKKITTMPGVECWRQSLPIDKIGLYIPGGTAPLFSTVLMLAIPATIAGCKEIILCTPPSKDGSIHPAILYTASLCGITAVYKVGGVQAIAAMTYGTKTIPRVFKIFGPGNQFVTIAKQLAQLEGVAIDMPAGPSEVLVIADETAIPEFVAADLLSQAEHGKDSQVMLLSTSLSMAEMVLNEIEKQIKVLPRNKIIRSSLANSKLLLFKDIKEAICFSNIYAPEHLILAGINMEQYADLVTSAGSVFIGNYSPESCGDYATGTNHTLPTNGFAAMYSGVSVDSFVKKISFQQLTKSGLKQIGESVMEMAAAEGLAAHKNAITIRLKD